MCRNVDNLYGWSMSQILPVNVFIWIKNTSSFDKDFINKYYENSDNWYFLEVDFCYPEQLERLHNDFPVLTGKISFENFWKNYLTLIWLRNMCCTHQDFKTNTINSLQQLWKKNKLMNNVDFWKIMENVRKNHHIEPWTSDRKEHYLMSEPDCHTRKRFYEIF